MRKRGELAVKEGRFKGSVLALASVTQVDAIA